jgi:hypothetical protein
MVPSNQLEIVLFWTIGIAIVIFAGVFRFGGRR